MEDFENKLKLLIESEDEGSWNIVYSILLNKYNGEQDVTSFKTQKMIYEYWKNKTTDIDDNYIINDESNIFTTRIRDYFSNNEDRYSELYYNDKIYFPISSTWGTSGTGVMDATRVGSLIYSSPVRNQSKKPLVKRSK